MDEVEELMKHLVEWSSKHGYKIIVPNDDSDDKTIDFININLVTKTMYFDTLNITEDLTEVG